MHVQAWWILKRACSKRAAKLSWNNELHVLLLRSKLWSLLWVFWLHQIHKNGKTLQTYSLSSFSIFILPNWRFCIFSAKSVAFNLLLPWVCHYQGVLRNEPNYVVPLVLYIQFRFQIFLLLCILVAVRLNNCIWIRIQWKRWKNIRTQMGHCR